jgi:glycosyltransferase involved in cell wall biosynthesis
MINLHVYPSPITHESRIEREVETIGSLDIFTSIEVAGVATEGLPQQQSLGEYGTVRRFAAEADSNSLPSRVAKAFGLGRAVLRHYSSKPVTVINCHSVSALPACVALKRATGAKLIYDTHELETEATAAVGFRRPIYKIAERRGIRHADHTFVVTETIEDWYRERYGLTNIDTIYNFPSRGQSTPTSGIDTSYFRRLYSLPDSTRTYLFQGALGSGRGLEVVAEAFAHSRVRDAVVVFLGFGPYESQVKRWAESNERIFFHPAVAPQALPSLTAAADVGLVPTPPSVSLSYYYSAGNKLFQYLRAGIPVIATRLPEHERFLNKYSAGSLMETYDVDSFVQACRSLDAKDPRQLSAGLARASDELCWENYTDLYRRRYEELTHTKGGTQ